MRIDRIFRGSRLRRAAMALFLSIPLAVPLDGQATEDAARVWFQMIVDGDFDGAAAGVAPSVRAQLNAQSLSGMWSQITAQTGAFESMTHTPVAGAPAEAVDFEATFANGSFAVRVVYDPEDRVAGFEIRPPGFFTPSEMTEDEAGKAAADFVALLMEARYEDAAMKASESVEAQMTAAVLENAWESVLSQTGGLVELGDSTVTEQGSMRIVDYAAEWDVGPATLRIVVGADGGIMGIQVVP